MSGDGSSKDEKDGPPYEDEEYVKLAKRYQATGGRLPTVDERTAMQAALHLLCPDCYAHIGQDHEHYCEIFRLTKKPIWAGTKLEIPESY